MDNTINKSENSFGFIPKTTKAKEYHEKYFLSRAVKKLKEINNLPVQVFVCGPTLEANKPLALKRNDTIDELRKLGHDANSGEELVSELKKYDDGDLKTTNVYERIVAAQSELIVIFCGSFGTVGETHDFLNIPEIAQKTLVFIERSNTGGYTGQGVIELHKITGLVEMYDPEDIDSCKLKGKVLEWVRHCQSIKWMSGKLAE